MSNWIRENRRSLLAASAIILVAGGGLLFLAPLLPIMLDGLFRLAAHTITALSRRAKEERRVRKEFFRHEQHQQAERQAKQDRQERETRERIQRDRQNMKDAGDKAAARALVEQYFSDHEAELADHLSRSSFLAWLRLQLSDERSAAEQWAACHAFIEQWHPIVVSVRKDRQSATRSINPNNV